MALRVKAENVPVKKVVLSADQGQGSMIVRQAYGNESSLMMATRPPGYHTTVSYTHLTLPTIYSV